MAWLNPKGEREHKLRREIDKQTHSLTMGMKKRLNVSKLHRLSI